MNPYEKCLEYLISKLNAVIDKYRKEIDIAPRIQTNNTTNKKCRILDAYNAQNKLQKYKQTQFNRTQHK